MNQTITTTAREEFTEEDSRDLARMVLRRFGYELDAATAAWRRLLGNSCPEHDFLDLVGHVHFCEQRERVGLPIWSDG